MAGCYGNSRYGKVASSHRAYASSYAINDWFGLVWFGMYSLFNGISTFVDYLMLKPSFKKHSVQRIMLQKGIIYYQTLHHGNAVNRNVKIHRKKVSTLPKYIFAIIFFVTEVLQFYFL